MVIIEYWNKQQIIIPNGACIWYGVILYTSILAVLYYSHPHSTKASVSNDSARSDWSHELGHDSTAQES